MSEAPRTRKTKVRTGCITCKIRKVKCDEFKPACKRCTDTGRKCDGYPKTIDVKRTGQGGVVAHWRSTPVWFGGNPLTDVASLPSTLSAEEQQWLLYFSRHTASALSSPVDTTFWMEVIPQLSYSDPAIRHALLAVASCHAFYGTEQADDLAVCSVQREFSVRHYNQAINSLQRQLAAGVKATESLLICCLLFICLECLYGNRALVFAHLRNGLNIINSSRPASVPSITRKLKQIFTRLDTQSTLFGKPVSPRTEALAAAPASLKFSSFEDAAEAQRSLDVLVSLSLNFVRSIHDNSFADLANGWSEHALQRRLQEQLLAWRNGLNHLGCTFTNRDQCSKCLVKLLHVQHSACFIYLSNCLEESEVLYDSFKPEFATIVGSITSLLKAVSFAQEKVQIPKSAIPLSSNTPFTTLSTLSFSLDSSLTPPLFLTATRCRDPIIRRRAISLLESSVGREGLWDSRLHSLVARRVMEIEEAGTVIANDVAYDPDYLELFESPQSQDCNVPLDPPDERSRVHDAVIVRTSEEPCRSARVTFYTAPNGVGEPLVSWDEDIHF